MAICPKCSTKKENEDGSLKWEGRYCPSCADETGQRPSDAPLACYIERSLIKVGERFRVEYKDIDTLAESIKKFGLMQFPVLDQYNNLIAGGRRLQAMDLLGWTQIPISRKGGVDELRLREMELEENIQRVNLTWQEDAKLRKAILEIKQRIYGVKGSGKNSTGVSANDLAVQMGESPSSFSADVRLAEAMEVIPGLSECKTKADAFKQMKALYEKLLVDELETRRQEAPHLLSSHLTRADAWFKVENAITALEAETESQGWGFVDVDTPYAIELMDIKKSQSEGSVIEHNYLEWTPEEYLDYCRRLAKEILRLSAADCWIVWWFGVQWYQPLKDILEAEGWYVRPVPGIWYATGGAQTNAPEVNLASSYETFFICSKGKPILQKRGRANVFEYKKLSPDKKIHPTEKPIELYVDLLETFTRKDTPCYSAFLGSGVIIRAALKTDRFLEGRDLNEEVKKRFLIKVQEDFPNG